MKSYAQLIYLALYRRRVYRIKAADLIISLKMRHW